MKQINETFKVRALFPCEHVIRFESQYEHDYVWRQTAMGCMVLQILQGMFHFNVTYPKENYFNMTQEAKREAIGPRDNDSVDIYVKPMELQAHMLDNAYPIQAIFMWRFGFILRRHYDGIPHGFYSQPFTKPVWSCIYTMILLGSVTFYILSWWDHQMFGIELSFPLEVLLAFSAYCQHILPLQAMSCSRRIAYLTFILCAYVVHCFYTSNLLSHLVSDKDEAMNLQSIVDEDYQIVLLKDMNLITDKKKYEMALGKNLSIVWNKVQQLKILDVNSALKAVIDTKTALLSDYITLYPIWKRYFRRDEICQLVEIDLYSNVKYYFFTSKNFSYKEEFKIGTLRAKEVGLLVRFMVIDKYRPAACEQSNAHYNVQFEHTLIPIALLLVAYLMTLLILLGEIIYHSRNRLWPYIE
ncbi:ionotropic receptor 75a-like [Vanessa tameamea]|uniref:Ionotropic receptor 75a-like n=1 Tax=Vanessa tameamea TaxID=334116 RepID=A0ABM4APJ4_VANTA